jgi:hypothetical protein
VSITLASGYRSINRSNSDRDSGFSSAGSPFTSVSPGSVACTTGGNCSWSPTSTNRSARFSAANAEGSVNCVASSTTATSKACSRITREPQLAVVAATTGASRSALANSPGSPSVSMRTSSMSSRIPVAVPTR